ncbi:peptidylprolyl isomerase [Persicirhabdus sediminis]|uniref:SurA N-terminal domain-containing protein n=1 Tax=Persicirhabdus sediminis TaxID=454144 RepID=A0A8J7SLP8_9BACT|nr:SurA N-terminal domain-containing protein [Persicirhabdus sediminis]MBK1790548.1 SurA N-terminal domain-containing protein [Persicirhabdus sediminis]
MRKYTGLMAFVFILLAAGFLFTMNSGSNSSLTGGPALLTVNGQKFDQKTYQREGSSTIQLANAAMLYAYVQQLGVDWQELRGGNLSAESTNQFIANRAITKAEAQKLGLYASDEAVTKFLHERSIFSMGGEFDQAAYNDFVSERLPRIGMRESDLLELFRDQLIFQQLVDLIGGNMQAPLDGFTTDFQSDQQLVTVEKITFDRDEFVKQQNPSEEEVKAFWEENRDRWLTDEQRKISYVIFNSTLPEDKEGDAALSETEKEAARAEHVKQVNRNVELVSDQIDASHGKEFKAAVESNGYKLTETELFTRGTVPAELMVPVNSRDNKYRLLSDAIFDDAIWENTLYERVSDPISIGDKNFVIFQITERVEPQVKEFEAAKVQAKAELIAENADKAVADAAAAALASINEKVAAGKSFEDAAKELELEVVKVDTFGIRGGDRPQNENNPNLVFNAAKKLNPNQVSEVLTDRDRAFFIHLVKRELEDSESNRNQLEQAYETYNTSLSYYIFSNWLREQFAAAKVTGRQVSN